MKKIQYEINDSWLPTSKNINALPVPIRKFIHGLETFCPSELVMENFELEQNFYAFKALCIEYKKIIQGYIEKYESI